MLNDKKLKELFEEAYKIGYITDLKTSECVSDCDECPAGPACMQLSTNDDGTGDYPLFLVNYKELMEDN